MKIPAKRLLALRLPGLAFLIPFLFALYTGHAWEDYYITYRASHNLATGHGLVFTPGERVQSFTSPLGTLLPALCAWVTGGNRDEAALWLYRLICCAFFAGGIFLLVRLSEHCRISVWGKAVLFGLLLTSAKTIDFTVNGMESALMIFFVAWCLVGFFVPPRRSMGWLAFGFAGLMWTRPDGFVPGGALAVSWLIFGGQVPEGLPWPQRIRLLAGSVLLGAVLYAPWFVWAWWYYGSPIPQTILAKGAVMSPVSVLHTWIDYPRQFFSYRAWPALLFTPSYSFMGGWPAFLSWFSRFLAFGAMLCFLWPKVRPEGKIASFGLFLGGFYLAIIPSPYPWYFPVWELVALVSLAFLADAAFPRLKAGGLQLFRVTVVTTTTVFAGVLFCVAREFRVQETYIEHGIRQPIGLWLRSHAAPDDTVFLEPLGYIGYYSQLKTYDMPGLSSREVVAVRKSGHDSFA